MGDTVWVRLMRVDLAKRQIELALITEADALAELSVIEADKNAEPVVETVLPKMPKHRSKSIEKLYDELAIAFESSEVHKHALAAGKEWYYSLSATPEFKESLVILGFNPKAEADKTYLAQTHLPETSFNREAWSKTIPTIESYLSEYAIENIVDTAFCPFRSQDEGAISKKDLELSLPIFQAWMKELQPKQVISFSARLRDVFVVQKLLSDVQEMELLAGKRKLKALKGFLKVGRKKVPVAFLPPVNTGLSQETKDEMWAWVKKAK
jgi:hypothetical protein